MDEHVKNLRFGRVSVQKEKSREAIGKKIIPAATTDSSILGTLALWGDNQVQKQ